MFCLIAVLTSCNQDDKIALDLLEEVEFGGIVRTLSINSGEFYVNNPESLFSIDIEEQDDLSGDLFEALDVYVSFRDKTVSETDLSTSEILLETLLPDSFERNSNGDGFPRRTLSYSFNQLLEATGLGIENVMCKDQFVIRFELRLTDGTVYNENTANALILAQNTSFSSPFSYVINVVSPVEENSFTGTYMFTSIVDGPLGESFTGPQPVEITMGHSTNNRSLKLTYRLTRRPPRDYDFTIACDQIVMGENLLSSTIGKCRQDQPDTGDLILLGPDSVNALINPEDDSVFELWFVEGYRDWDGDCGFSNSPSRLRFTKQ